LLVIVLCLLFAIDFASVKVFVVPTFYLPASNLE
jgi:hypothetical protein